MEARDWRRCWRPSNFFKAFFFSFAFSGISSILVIGKVGVESFLKRHEDKLSRTSLLGKICLAASLLPVFVLTALFKIGAIAITYVWDEAVCLLFLLLAIGIPSLLLLVLKAYLPLKDLTVASISQGVNAQGLILQDLSFPPDPSFHTSSKSGRWKPQSAFW